MTSQHHPIGRDTQWLAVIDRTDRLERGEYPLPTEAELLSVIARVVAVSEGCFILYPFGRGHERESLLGGVSGPESLFVGVSGPLAFAQFMPWGRPDIPLPLFAATNLPREQSYVGFNIGGTLTEIPRHRCVPIDSAIAICKHYYATLTLLPGIDWETMDSFTPLD